VVCAIAVTLQTYRVGRLVWVEVRSLRERQRQGIFLERVGDIG